MTLHPSLREVLMGLDEMDQDIVEKMCDADWDRVTFDPEGRVLVDKRRTIFVLEPEVDPSLEIFYLNEDGSEQTILIDLTDDPTITTLPVQPDPPSETPLTDSLAEIQPLSTVIHPLCPCGCGQEVVNAPTGRKRKWASEACRRNANRKPRPASPTTPVVEPPVEQAVEKPVERPKVCARCDEPGHFVEDCSFATRQAAMKAKAPKRPAKTHEAPRVITCAKCHERGHSIFTCPQQEALKAVVVPPLSGEGVTDNDLTAHSQALLDLCKDGLPDRFQYSFLPDVLALYGVDHDLLDSCLRSPDRVEIRPESFEKDKRYCVLGFYKGDLEAILGMRSPAAPKVIAVYATSRLEHDTHRVGHTGGGGAKGKAPGLPKTSKQVATRLRSMGAEVEISITEDYTDVTYQGQNLGKVACNGDRKTCEQDFQRIQRKMAAIDRRVSA